MTDRVTAQGSNPTAQMPMAAASAPSRVSADSFRKLSLLLKKPDAPTQIIAAPRQLEVAKLDSIVEIPPLFPARPAPIVPPVELAAIPATPAAQLLRAEAAPSISKPEVPRLHGLSVAPAPAAPTPLISASLERSTPMVEAVPHSSQVAAFVSQPSKIDSLHLQSLASISEPPLPSTAPNQIEMVTAFASPVPAQELAAERPRPELAPQSASPPELRPAPLLGPEPPRARVEAAPIIQTPEQEAEAAELARSLLDMMAQGSAAGQPQERALAADTLLRMLPRLPLKSRVMLSNRLSMMEQPHHQLVAKLITDPDISVAGPLLEECAQLSDEDLLRVVAERDPAKRRMLGRRRKISRPVTKALIETDDPSVLLTIARNAGAEITAEGFAMMEQAAARRSELLAPLCIRADLPVHFAFSLFWQAPPELRRYLLSRFLTDSETLTKILKIARVSVNVGDGGGDRPAADPDTVKNALLQAASGDMASAAKNLAAMSTLEPETITRILDDHQGEPLMALLKTLAFPRSQILELVETLKSPNQGLIEPSRSAEELQSMFDSLSFNKARILLTYWDWFTMGSGPYALMQ